MLSARLVQLIEGNWEEIANRVIKEIRKNPELATLARKPNEDLRDWSRKILENISYLLTASKEDEVKRRFQVLGKVRFEESVPLHETVLRFHLLKDKIFGFIHEQGFAMDTLHLYAEEELEHRMGRFFDACVYHVVRGYEDARRRADRMAS